MKINPTAFGLASAATAAVSWIICSTVVGMMPGPMMNMSGHMVHANLDGMNWTLTFSGVVVGLIVWTLFAGLFGWALASIYNLMNKKSEA